MTSEAQFSRNLKTHNVLFVLAALIMSVSGSAATTDEQDFYKHQYYLLKRYKLIYTKEIFNFCVYRKRLVGSKLKRCLRENDKLKRRILNDAREQLGTQSLAQNIYDDCVDYYPLNGVGRIRKCVRTRLVLDDKLKDITIEEIIYQKCDFKWRKHGSGAIDNCSRSEANYYRRKGRLRD